MNQNDDIKGQRARKNQPNDDSEWKDFIRLHMQSLMLSPNDSKIKIIRVDDPSSLCLGYSKIVFDEKGRVKGSESELYYVPIEVVRDKLNGMYEIDMIVGRKNQQCSADKEITSQNVFGLPKLEIELFTERKELLDGIHRSVVGRLKIGDQIISESRASLDIS